MVVIQSTTTLHDIALLGLNRAVDTSPFHDWEFVTHDKIPATVRLMHNVLQIVKIADSPLPSHRDGTLRT